MQNDFGYNELFMTKLLYLIDNEKNWAKVETLINGVSSNITIPLIVLNTILLRAKLELNKTSESKELIEYNLANIDNVVKSNDEDLRDIILCNLFDYSFRLLASENLYSKISSNDTLALFACSVLNKVALYDIKTYRSHIIQIFMKLKKAKDNNTAFTSNYILANYYMIMFPFKQKLVANIIALKRKLNTNANSFIFND